MLTKKSKKTKIKILQKTAETVKEAVAPDS
jgi:hypothetical protein